MIEVKSETACWEWQGMATPEGYGEVEIRGKIYRVHRLMYMLWHGDFNITKSLHHECENRRCCNPSHMALIDEADHWEYHPNGLAGRNKAKTHCKRGHEFTEENTVWKYNLNGRLARNCRQCNKDRAKDWAKTHPRRRRNRAENNVTKSIDPHPVPDNVMEPKQEGGQQYARFREMADGLGSGKDRSADEAGAIGRSVESLVGSGHGGERVSGPDEGGGGDRPEGVLDSAEERRARFQRLKKEYGGIEVEME